MLARQIRSACHRPTTPPHPTNKKEKQQKFLLKLDGPLSSPEIPQAAACKDVVPTTFQGSDDSGEPATFCKVNNVLPSPPSSPPSSATPLPRKRFPPSQPTQLSASTPPSRSIAHVQRQISASRSGQDEYPVWYFFYSTLADPAVLTRLLELDRALVYLSARIREGVLKVWGGKCKALVNAPAAATAGCREDFVVDGSAFLVKSGHQEEALRRYETDQYEVVRCEIEFRGGEPPVETVCGLSFRFVGEEG
ncbi:hypothetical protein B0H63DRAFT_564709 [Podospora didyma]|uniref:Gamma-glutamylcyclotransferase AIG2-like domain-containing protein n=1 Tax=Podospora didyma TaxID=330526 RepID=A0AAE0N559_9PEZI|nr:hypothetical protein B0H63DRAFT_564709 [Podospora didyma]